AVREAHTADQLRQAWEKEETYRREAEQLSIRLALKRAQTLCEQGDAGRGILWLTRGLEIAPSGQDLALHHAIRVNLSAWSQQVHPLRFGLSHPREVIALAVSPDGKSLATAS